MPGMFTHSAADGRLGYFQFWCVRNNTARNTGEYNYFFLFLPGLPPPPPLPSARSLLCKYRGAVEWLGHMGGTYLTFKEAIRLDSSGFPCLYSDHQRRRFLVTLQGHQHLVGSV